MQEKYEDALESKTDLDKKIVKPGNLNELAHENLMLWVNTSSTVKNIAFGLVQNAKSLEFPDSNCKLAWDRLINKYTSNTISSLLKLKSEFLKFGRALK